MDWNPAVSRRINIPFESGDVVEFVRLLRENPQYLYCDDGTDLWMWRAAMNNDLPMLQALAELGADVNVPKDALAPDDPDCSFCQVEGPIVQAAGKGHTEVVRWLIERGAKLNYTVNGKVRCLSLLDAATKGHLETVKLLVQSGADIHASFNGHTPLSQAIGYGHVAVANYLRSVGADAEPTAALNPPA